MYKILTIGKKDYKLEYTIEASLYADCTEKLIEFFGNTLGVAEEKEITKDLPDSEKKEVRAALLKNSIKGISNLPITAITVFYAGLIEHHGENGDKSVMSIEDAKNVVKNYFQDHSEDGQDNFFDLMMICIDQMGEDGFFKRTGLEKMMSQNMAENQNRSVRRAKSKASGK